MKNIICITILLFSCSLLQAQLINFTPEKLRPADSNFPFSSKILDLKMEKKKGALRTAKPLIAEDHYYTKGDSVLVECSASTKEELDVEALNAAGAKLHYTYENYATGYIQIDDLLELDEKVTTNNFIRMIPIDHAFDNQGPSLTNSDSYVNGTAGSGIKIAIIDSGFGSYNAIMNNTSGSLPSSYIFYDCTSGVCVSSGTPTGTSTHGTSCVQIVYDHAPLATYRLYRVNGAAQRAAAITHADGINADVISMSQSSYNTGWEDDSGVVCSATNGALSNNDMLIFVSAGNRNGTHYQSFWSDSNGNNWHNFSGNDERNNFTISNGGVTRLDMQWSGTPVAGIRDYDLFLFDANTNALLASSTNASSFEELNYVNTTGSTQSVYLGVRNVGIIKPEFEIFNHDDNNSNFQYSSTDNSTTSPSNSTEPNVLSIAAVDRIDYDDSNPPTMDYSSIGPSNQGGGGIDLAGPTNCTVATATGGSANFGGTSCATPNAAGTAVAFWSRHPSITANNLRKLLLKKASLYKDWGAGAYDDNYGSGGIYLYDYSNVNVFVDQLDGVNGIAPDGGIYPWDNVKDVNNLGLSGRNVVLLSNDLNAAPIILDKQMLLTTDKTLGSKRIE